jgi:hypothetical protein
LLAGLATFLAVHPAHAQEVMRWYGDIPLHPVTVAVHEVRLEASGGFDSDALHNDLVLGLIQGKTLDRGTREASAADLSSLNRFMQTVHVRAT